MRLTGMVERARHAVALDERRPSFAPALWEPPEEGGRHLQQWFPGEHASVGGGGSVTGLSAAALLWIAQGARAAGLALDGAALGAIAAEVDPLAPPTSPDPAPTRRRRASTGSRSSGRATATGRIGPRSSPRRRWRGCAIGARRRTGPAAPRRCEGSRAWSRPGTRRRGPRAGSPRAGGLRGSARRPRPVAPCRGPRAGG